jgi:hypothetical protein
MFHNQLHNQLHDQLHHHLRRNLLGLLVVGVVGSAACGGESGSPGERGQAGSPGEAGDSALAPLVQTEAVAPGAECANGGTRVVTGMDADRSGDLSEDEIAAGSSTLLCSSAQTECVDPVRITGISGAEQRYFEGVESAELTVELNSATGVELSYVAPDIQFNASDGDGTFTIVPHGVGGPFQVAVIAWDGCTSHMASFTIEEVEPAVGYLHGVAAFFNADPVVVSEEGASEPLFEFRPFLLGTNPVWLDYGTYRLEVTGGPPSGMGPDGGEFEMGLGASVTLASYLDVVNDAYVHKWLFLDDDISSPGSNARVRAINLNSYLPSVSLEVLGQNNARFDALAFAQPAAPQTVSPEALGLGVDVDSDGTNDRYFVFDDPLFTAGTVANVFVINPAIASLPPVDIGALVLVQNLGAAFPRIGRRAGMPPIDFANDTSLPRFATTNGYVEWDFDSSTFTSGGQSLRADISGWNASSTFEMTVFVPADGTLSFDWKVASDGNRDFLSFCLDPLGACDGFTNTKSITGSIDWTSTSVPVVAGAHTLRWVFEKGNSGPMQGDAWIDNVSFAPVAP